MIYKVRMYTRETRIKADRLLSTADQHNCVTVWYLKGDKVFDIVTCVTGGEEPTGYEFLGTVVLDSGDYVTHVFFKEMNDVSV